MEGNPSAVAPVGHPVVSRELLAPGQSATRFCDIATYLSDAILEFDPQDRCIFANPPALQLFALCSKHIQGQPITGLGLPPELGAAGEIPLREARRSGAPQALETLSRQGDRTRHFEARFIPQPTLPQAQRRVVMVVRDITEFRKAEEAARLNALRVKQVSRQVLRVQEQSSRHLAKELHDEIGQTFTAVKFSLQNLADAKSNAQRRAMIRESIEMVDDVLARIRSLSLDLRPSLLDDLGLEAALRSLARRQAGLGKFEADISIALPAERLDADIEITCYRIFQEGLTNVLKYAHAQKVWLRLAADEQSLYGYLADNGRGFDVDAALGRAIAGGSTGLLSMQERAMLMGGRLQIESDNEQGTRHYLELPLSLQRSRPAGNS